jgi:hypothetical protein
LGDVSGLLLRFFERFSELFDGFVLDSSSEGAPKTSDEPIFGVVAVEIIGSTRLINRGNQSAGFAHEAKTLPGLP